VWQSSPANSKEQRNEQATIVNSAGEAPPHWVTSDSKISYAEFLDWADEDTLAEWVDGNVVMTSPANVKHQDIGRFLIVVLELFVTTNNLGKILQPPFQMKLSSSGREPDLIFVKKERLSLLQNSFMQGPADLAVEIVSPESIARDHETKFGEYAAGGVPEYWLLDATENTATFYQLDANRQYQLIPLDPQGRYFSNSIAGLWLKPAWLWRQSLPNPLDALFEIGNTKFTDYFSHKKPGDLA